MEWLALTLIAALAWLWYDSLAAREIAVAAARAACASESYLFLDDTVAFTSLRLTRDGDGRVKLQRSYAFEYSDTGNNRVGGSVIARGHEVVLINVGVGERLH